MMVKPTMITRNLKVGIMEEEEDPILEAGPIQEEIEIDLDQEVPVTADSETGPDLEVTVDNSNL